MLEKGLVVSMLGDLNPGWEQPCGILPECVARAGPRDSPVVPKTWGENLWWKPREGRNLGVQPPGISLGKPWKLPSF
jgi:hypothetical protein